MNMAKVEKITLRTRKVNNASLVHICQRVILNINKELRDDAFDTKICLQF